MLVLTRRIGEQINIGDGITVTVVATNGGRIRIGVDAPKDVRILRAEVSPVGPPRRQRRRQQVAKVELLSMTAVDQNEAVISALPASAEC